MTWRKFITMSCTTGFPRQRHCRRCGDHAAPMQVIELRALRDLAADLYSFTTLSIEAQEVQSKMASLREQHAEILPSAESLQADGPLTASSSASTSLVTSGLVEEHQQGQSLVSAFRDSQLFEPDPKQQSQAGSSDQNVQQVDVEKMSASSTRQAEDGVDAPKSEALESDEASDEVAEMANALWEDAEGDMELDTQTDADLNTSSNREQQEQQPEESIILEPNRAIDRLDRLQNEPDHSMPPALASTRPSGHGNGAAAENGYGLEMPLRGERKDELKELQEEMQIELHSGKLQSQSTT